MIRTDCSVERSIRLAVSASLEVAWFKLFSIDLAATTFSRSNVGVFVCGALPPPRILAYPPESVVAERPTPVPCPVTVTVAPATAAPCASRTRPRSVAAVVWA